MARRQEQEPARSAVTEVAPDVLRLELPIRMPGLGHVNCYAIVDERGAAIIDPGLPGPTTWRVLQDRLKQADLAVKDDVPTGRYSFSSRRSFSHEKVARSTVSLLAGPGGDSRSARVFGLY